MAYISMEEIKKLCNGVWFDPSHLKVNDGRLAKGGWVHKDGGRIYFCSSVRIGGVRTYTLHMMIDGKVHTLGGGEPNRRLSNKQAKLLSEGKTII